MLTVHKDYPCNPKNYRKGRKQAVAYLVIHYVGATGDAKNNAKYYSTTPYIGASAHYFVGHRPRPTVWASVPEGDTAYHCGAKKYIHPECRNDNSIGVELCCHKDAKGNWYFDPETVNTAVELCRDIVARYGIDRNHVLRHYDVTGKVCPAPFVRDWTAWDDFKIRLFAKEETELTDEVKNYVAQTVASAAQKLREDLTPKAYATLADVPVSYRDVLGKLMNAGALKGYDGGADGLIATIGDNKIQVDETFCRVLTILSRPEALEAMLGRKTPEVYNTVAECPQWAQPAVAWAVSSGLIRGDEVGRLGLDSTKLWTIQVEYNAKRGDK